MADKSMQSTDPSGCYPFEGMRSAHDDMRTDKYQSDIGDADLEGEKTDELMRPQSGDEVGKE